MLFTYYLKKRSQVTHSKGKGLGVGMDKELIEDVFFQKTAILKLMFHFQVQNNCLAVRLACT